MKPRRLFDLSILAAALLGTALASGCAGWPVQELRSALAGLRIPGEEYSIEAESVMRGPFRATCVSVNVVKTSHHRHLGQIRTIIGAARDRADAVRPAARDRHRSAGHFPARQALWRQPRAL